MGHCEGLFVVVAGHQLPRPTSDIRRPASTTHNAGRGAWARGEAGRGLSNTTMRSLEWSAPPFHPGATSSRLEKSVWYSGRWHGQRHPPRTAERRYLCPMWDSNPVPPGQASCAMAAGLRDLLHVGRGMGGTPASDIPNGPRGQAVIGGVALEQPCWRTLTAPHTEVGRGLRQNVVVMSQHKAWPSPSEGGRGTWGKGCGPWGVRRKAMGRGTRNSQATEAKPPS